MPAILRRVRSWVGAAAVLAMLLTGARGEDSPPWTVATKESDLTIYQRPHKGSDLREFKAVGEIAAPVEIVKQVLDDVSEYPRFMPYVVEARVISQDAKSRVTYQRISPPFVGDRDYAVKVKFEVRRTPEGNCYCNRWQAANELGPAEKKGVTRVKVTEGYRQLDPIDGGRATRATYFIFSDSGGSLPTAILNAASRTGIPKIFDGVRKQVRLEKYTKAR